MSPSLLRYARVVLAALLALVLFSCRGGSGISVVEQTPGLKAVQLSLQQVESTGGHLVYAVGAESGQAIFQLSTRVVFDPLAVRPVDVQRGGLVGQQAVFFALDNQPGFVPLAFTYHQGDSYSKTTGEVAQIEFEVMDANRPANVRFSDDAEYLVARDARGNDLPVTLAVAR